MFLPSIVCAGTAGAPFALAMTKMALCVPAPISKQVFVMIGNFTLALPCIVDGNKECLKYDIKTEGGVNFYKWAKMAAGKPNLVENFNEMGRLCDVAHDDVAKAKTPMEVTTRTCTLLGELMNSIKKTGAANCPLLPNVLNALNALAIVQPKNFKAIFSLPNNLKHVLNIKNIIKSLTQ